jgi:hypothetical protein
MVTATAEPRHRERARQDGIDAGDLSPARTAPGIFRACSIVLVVVIAVMWVVGWTSTTRRHDAVHTIWTRTEPLTVEAQQIHASLSEADASAADAFLAGGSGSSADELRYEQSIAAAASVILKAEQGPASAGDRQALLTVGQQLPVYTGLVAEARALNRQNLPLGAAYLRAASSLMQTTILAATDRVTVDDASQLDRSYRDATRSRDAATLLGAVIVVTIALVATQALVFARSNRVFNVPLVVATVAVIGASAWMLHSFSTQRSDMVRARDQGFVPSSLVSEARVLAFRADGDQSLSAIARGDGAAFDADFDTALARIGFQQGKPSTTGSLIDVLDASGARAVKPQVSAAAAAIEAYAATNASIRAAVDSGSFTQAVALVQGPSATSFQTFDTESSSALSATQLRFETGLGAADRSLRDLAVIVTLAALLAAALALVGLQLRIREYR